MCGVWCGVCVCVGGARDEKDGDMLTDGEGERDR